MGDKIPDVVRKGKDSVLKDLVDDILNKVDTVVLRFGNYKDRMDLFVEYMKNEKVYSVETTAEPGFENSIWVNKYSVLIRRKDNAGL